MHFFLLLYLFSFAFHVSRIISKMLVIYSSFNIILKIHNFVLYKLIIYCTLNEMHNLKKKNNFLNFKSWLFFKIIESKIQYIDKPCHKFTIQVFLDQPVFAINLVVVYLILFFFLYMLVVENATSHLDCPQVQIRWRLCWCQSILQNNSIHSLELYKWFLKK